MATIDYKALLVKYIRHVEECDGTNFIDQAGGGNTDSLNIWELTPDEITELKRLSIKEQINSL